MCLFTLNFHVSIGVALFLSLLLSFTIIFMFITIFIVFLSFLQLIKPHYLFNTIAHLINIISIPCLSDIKGSLAVVEAHVGCTVVYRNPVFSYLLLWSIVAMQSCISKLRIYVPYLFRFIHMSYNENSLIINYYGFHRVKWDR